ncbi:MAG: histidine--tRNA ligase, partial [Clostridiales Family XIII bacterium]|nr:histidine--tRNA ligase [Clostridiales Family XIII bacterium]
AAKLRALGLAAELRRAGIACEVDAMGRSTKNQFKYADRLGVRYAVTLGDDELAAGTARLKDMQTGEQEDVAFSLLAERLSRTEEA